MSLGREVNGSAFVKGIDVGAVIIVDGCKSIHLLRRMK